MIGPEVEYVGDGTPGWPGVWPEPGDRGRVLDEDGDSVIVRWLLRETGREVEVWTWRDRVREVPR